MKTLQNQTHEKTQSGLRIAKGLGVFSIALGLLEIFATRAISRRLGLKGMEPIIALYGLREIANGIGILVARNPQPWVQTRLAGDALDMGTLALGMHSNGNHSNTAGAGTLMAVAGVTALDVFCAKRLMKSDQPATHDYSDRSGFPRDPQFMRGMARDFLTPRDMRAPDALHAYEVGSYEGP